MARLCSFFRSSVTSLAVVCASGCQSLAPRESYGLNTVIAMELSSEELSVMDMGAYAKSPTFVPLTINGESFRARVNYAGHKSIDALKRSYDVQLSRTFRGRTGYRLSAMAGDLSALRSLLSYRAYSAMGFDVPATEPVAVWVNETYVGLFLLMERYDEDYFESHETNVVQLYKAVNAMGNFFPDVKLKDAFTVKLGDASRADLQAVADLVAVSPSEANYVALEKVVNLDSVISYMATTSLLDNQDGSDNNYFLLRTK